MCKKLLFMVLGLVFCAGTAMAAVNATTYGEAPPSMSNFWHTQIEVDADALTVPSDGTVQLMKVPAGTMITFVHVEIDTKEGEACYVDIGDGDDVNRFVDDLDANSSAGDTETSRENDGSGTGVFLYESADTIDLLFESDGGETAMQADTAVVTVTIAGFQAQ